MDNHLEVRKFGNPCTVQRKGDYRWMKEIYLTQLKKTYLFIENLLFL